MRQARTRLPIFALLSIALVLLAGGTAAIVFALGQQPGSTSSRQAPAPPPTEVTTTSDPPPTSVTVDASTVPPATQPAAQPTGQHIAPPGALTATPRAEDPRVEAALASLTTDEQRVGQLLMLGWVGNTAEQAETMIAELRPGAIVHVDNARRAADAITVNDGLRRLASSAGVPPPLIAIDHEGGNVQRINDVPNLGSNAEFAKNATEADACSRGSTHATQLKRLGFSMNLAPVVDVNNNPANPVIGIRSYGADPRLVARLGAAYIRGLQSGGIAAVAKHFPGHGNTAVDSHLLLPILPQTVDDLERIELVPFRRAIELPVSAVMSAHIVFPAVDPSGMPATLSRSIMTGILRERLGYDGLVLTDDLAGMKAITDNFKPGEAAVRALDAGVDMLIVAGGLARQRESRDAILAAIGRGELTRERIDESVRRVLRVKARFGLFGGEPTRELGCA
jgi:beta-N-acetylhexosaminidase